MTGAMWFSVVFAWAVGMACGAIARPMIVSAGLWLWNRIARPHRPDDGPVVARSVYEAMPPVKKCRCTNPTCSVSTPVNSELLRMAKRPENQPPQSWFDETTDPTCKLNRELDVIACRPDTDELSR